MRAYSRAPQVSAAQRSPCAGPRSRRLRCVTRAALPDEDAPAEKLDAPLRAAARAPSPVSAVVWGGNLPSPRRAALGGLSGLAVVLGGNLGGVTTQLLSTAPERARALRLDAVYPIGGLRREVHASAGYELCIPTDWLADQTVARRRAALAELERGPLDPPSLRAASARRSSLPDSAYGPPGSSGEANISVIVEDANAFGVRFTLASMGPAREVAERLLANVIARPGSGKTATLLDVKELRNDDTALPIYQMEFVVRAPTFERHNLSLLYGDAAGRLFTYTAQVPAADWAGREALLRQCAASFRVWS